jgi:MinD superfamily P-loop ATPase
MDNMIISIASGKGGTGKTTVATNLAAAVSSDVQLLDCDVEEPNAHLFFYNRRFKNQKELGRQRQRLTKRNAHIAANVLRYVVLKPLWSSMKSI